MRTRWDEVEDVDGGSHRFMGFSAVTWAMAVPVALIAGAAVMSFFGQSQPDTTSLTIPAPAVSDHAKAVNGARVGSDKGRWEEEARQAATKAAELQMQVEALRDQVSDEARRRQQAEQTAAQAATTLEKVQQEQKASQQHQPATAVAVSNPVQPSQGALSYAAPGGSGSTAFGSQSASDERTERAVSASTDNNQVSGRANDDSIALQRIIEDTASRSAALSDRRDEMESDATSSTSNMRPANTSRSVADVESALEKATGLDTLSVSQRGGLKDELVAGACVTVSLEKVFGNPVPVVPLRNLVRDLDSDC
ncbi:hypothetical protein GAO09_00530 [Rhizobiales bacterium RZME27]|uniref:Uncharacterized protein n=1 Tax=Endobacterium cereale TaxID=2663029 RepID=A0A6A8A4T2_9HYPH|nr:hypothetical protein [Endobacterium cereale]MEB2843441.1 hypothetical protein [Endobacterium cereale]MQY44560.1 hypothetical protein [Endobacterium cereale]